MLRFLLVEAAQAAARIHPDWRRRYKRLAMRRHKSIAKVALGRRMTVETSASFDARYAPLSYPTEGGEVSGAKVNLNAHEAGNGG